MTQVNTEGQALSTDGDNTLENEVQISDDVLSTLPDEAVSTIKTLMAQKKHFRDKYENESTTRVGLEKKIQELSPKDEPKAKKEDKTSDEEWRQRMEFAITNRDLNKDDLDTVFRLSKSFDLQPGDILNHDVFKAYQKVKEEKASTANTTPTPGSESPVLNSFSNFEKVQPSDISKMDSATFAKYEKWLAQKTRK